MLESKVDKQIKRYLKSICDNHSVSKINGSCHYKVQTERGVFHIRFADHFSASGKISDFDIVKVREFYIIKFETIQYSLYADDILIYIKALLLVGPELSNQLKQSREQTLTALNSLNYYKCKWNKHQEDVKFMDDIWAEKEKVEAKNKELLGYKDTYSILQAKYDKAQNDLKTKIRQFNSLQNSFNSLQNSFNKLKKQFTQSSDMLNRIKQLINK